MGFDIHGCFKLHQISNIHMVYTHFLVCLDYQD